MKFISLPVNKNTLLRIIHIGISAFFLFFAGFFFTSCHSRKSNGTTIPDPKVTPVQLSIKRYERDLFSADQSNLAKEVTRLAGEYRFFLGNNPAEPANLLQLRSYLNDQPIRMLYHETQKLYPDLSELTNSLSKAFGYFHHYFPEKKIPQVFTFVSGLDYENPVRYVDTVMIIALDMYLGKDARFYKALQLPVYKTLSFSKEFIVPDCMKQIAWSMIKEDKKDMTLLDLMVMQGKLLYFADLMLPETQDEFKIDYTPEQIAWCRKSASEIWSFFIANKLLYSTDSKQNMTFIADAPFTKGFPKQSPGRTGSWLGWQIVRAYMAENPKLSIQDLIQEHDSQKILSKSHFKPEKS